MAFPSVAVSPWQRRCRLHCCSFTVDHQRRSVIGRYTCGAREPPLGSGDGELTREGVRPPRGLVSGDGKLADVASPWSRPYRRSPLSR